MNAQLEIKLSQLPDSPGCYLMKSKGEIIYVGKAKNLKNRVRQYFQSSRNHTPKVCAMVSKVDDFDIVLVDGELEALILECNLIKLHRPHYNILLKDDKQYPYIRIDLRQDFPRVELVRRMGRDGARYFGPYIGATAVREVMDVLRSEFPLRTCANLPSGGAHKRACVHAQIGQCMAPCTGSVTRDEYHAVVKRVIDFLNGNDADIVGGLEAQMRAASQAMQFEKAAMYRDRLRAVREVMQKQKAVNVRGDDYDVLACASDGEDALVQALFMRAGKLIGSETFVMEHGDGEAPGQLLEEFMLQYYDEDHQIPPMILVQELTEDSQTLEGLLREKRGGALEIRLPQRGDKRQMMEMAFKNARDAADKRAAQLRRSYERTTGALEELKRALGLERLPRRIEGYDISNTQGALSVASMVVMQDGLPDKKEYRHFRIKTVEGPNDFASMHEVIERRFRHGVAEREELAASGRPVTEGKFARMPDLVLIDGGPEQLKNALDAAHAAGVSVPMFGLAKRIEEIYLPGRDETILLDRHSSALHLIQRLRDEAHRFAITHHRQLRARSSISSQLDTIAGIGEKRKRALLRHFKTVEQLRSASIDELLEADGMSRPAAEAVHAFFHGAQDATAVDGVGSDSGEHAGMAEAVEPLEADEPVEATAPAGAGEPAKVIKPAGAGEPAGAGGMAKAAELAGAGEPAKATKPSGAGEPD